ncbi:MAG TPA: hypothetical protein DCS93_44180 [Microscillaceae bacterium]|nr:hypothetical protein [Microscillaceae bacterium]
MKKYLFILMTTLTSGQLHAQSNTLDQITTAAAQTIANGKMYRYHFKSFARGKLADRYPVTSGKVQLVIAPNDFSGAIRQARLLAKSPQGKTDVYIHQGTVYRVFADSKKVYRTPRYRAASNLFDEQMLLPAYTLKDLKNASKKQGKLLREENYQGTVCHVVNITSEGQLNLSFWLDKRQHLIHKVEATTPAYPGSTLVMEFTQVAAGLPVQATVFQPNIPPTYTLEEYSGKFPKIGSLAKDWSVETYQGKALKLSEMRGKVVVLDFWATWCRPCLQAMPHLQKLANKYQTQGLIVIGLTTQEKGKPLAMAQKLKIRYPIAEGNAIAKAYKVNGLPFAIVIGKDGKIVDFLNGYLGTETDQMLEKIVKQALKN